MSEQNILNPTAASQLNPSYSIPHKDPQIDASWQARSGQEYDRDMMARGMEWQLHWDKVPFSTYLSLRQWFRQYRKGFFSYIDFDDSGRYYSGKFLAEPQFERVGNNQVNISATFIEIPKVAMFQYPGNWGIDSTFVEERGDYGQDLVKLTGSTTNWLAWSEAFDQWSTSSVDVTVTANNQANPITGGLTADTIATGATAAKGVFLLSGVNAANGTQNTFSVWLKAAANVAAVIGMNRANGSGADQETTAIMITNAWQRFTFTHSATWTGTDVIAALITITNATTSIFAWGAQLEASSFAGPYIATRGAAVGPVSHWDRGRNYALSSEQLDSTAWSKTNAVVTANAVNDPNGNLTADAIVFSVTGSTSFVLQFVTVPAPVAGQQFAFSCWLKVAAGTQQLTLQVLESGGNQVAATVFTLTTVWQRFSVSGTMLQTSSATARILLRSPDSTTATYHAWGAQLEYGAAPTTYVTTTETPVILPTAGANANFHGGFAYLNSGTVAADAAEWMYVGYGFRVWAPKGPDMGIVQVFLDGVSQGAVDLFAAAAAPSAVVLTLQNVSLGQHRVKLQATNTKNAASSAFNIAADAIEVMR
jgi:hypothetical protein